MHPFCVKVSQRENEWQASFTSTAYILFWVLVIASYLFADKIGCMIGRFVFARTCDWDLARAKGLIWAESEIVPFAESNRIH